MLLPAKSKVLSLVTNIIRNTHLLKHSKRPYSIASADLSDVDEYFDIVVAGGGLVGGTCAVAFGRSPLLADSKILLLEAAKMLESSPPGAVDGTTTPFSNRVYSISPGSKRFFEKLGLWDDVWRSQKVSAMQVWDALSDAKLTLNNPNFEPVSYIVESPVLSYSIEKALTNAKNVQIMFGSRLENLVMPSSAVSSDNTIVKLSCGKRIATKLLVGADGFNSKVRNAIKSPYLNGNYNRMGIVATLRLIENTDNNIAWQRFLPTGGPIAILPLSPEFSSLVWSTTLDHGKDLLKLSDPDFVDAVNSALWKDYPRSEFLSTVLSAVQNLIPKRPRMLPPSFSDIVPKSRASFPLGYGHAAHYVNRRVALIGDAAHRVHPLGGQGLNLGIGDVAELLKSVETSIRIGEDIGYMKRLQTYETARQRHNAVIQSGLDALHRLYDFQFAPITVVRSLGLTAFDRCSPLKASVMSQASA